MPKKVIAQIKLQIPAGKANPAPPVGPALGQHKVNIMEFCKAFNAATQNKEGLIIPAVISVYEDRSFTFITKSPPAAVLLKREANIAKASGQPNKEFIATIKRETLKKVALEKMKDLNTDNIEKAVRIIEGTARSMGIKIED